MGAMPTHLTPRGEEMFRKNFGIPPRACPICGSPHALREYAVLLPFPARVTFDVLVVCGSAYCIDRAQRSAPEPRPWWDRIYRWRKADLAPPFHCQISEG